MNTADWQDKLSQTNPRFRRNGDYSQAATGRRLRRLLEKELRRIEKQEKRGAKK